MTRRTGPDEAYRTVYLPDGRFLAGGLTARLYADAAGTTPADVLTEAGATIPTSGTARVVTLDSTSGIPRLQYPASGSEIIYCSVNGGAIKAVLSDRKQRDDELATVQINVKDYGALGDGTTDDTAAIATAFAAVAAGATVRFPAASSFYRITGPVTPPSGVRVQGSGNGCEIRQSTQFKPVFDLFNVDSVTISGFTLTNASGPPSSVGTGFRGDSGYAYSTGVWANGNRIIVEDLRIKDFAMGVYLNASNGTLNGVAPLRIGNRLRRLEISGANHGVLYLMQEDLQIEDIYSHDHVDSSSGVNPLHAVYGTGTASLRSKHVNVKNCNARNITAPVSSCGYQFKYVDGLTFENLRADNCHGLLNIIDCNDISADNLQSVNTLGTVGNGYALWTQVIATNPTRLSITNVSIQMATPNASVLGLIADDARVSNLRFDVCRTAASAGNYDTQVRGSRVTIDGLKVRNSGTGNGNGVLVGSGTLVPTADVTISNIEFDGTTALVDFDQACTGTNTIVYTAALQRRITNPESSWFRVTSNGSLSGGAVTFTAAPTGSAPALSALAADQLTIGEMVPRRDRIISNTVGASSGSLVLSYFTADKTEVINTLTAFTGNTAAAATPTLCRMGIYSVAANGDLTLVGSTPNDTALFAVVNTAYPKTMSSTFNKVVGVRYATAILVVSGAAVPTFHGIQLAATAPLNTISRLEPPIIGRVLGQTDLPASVATGVVVGFQAMIAMQLS